ncbi:MAG: hypothetical protein MI742_03720 [Desulfobacterales bacterium]|nr:hypothetical protein [Desulfobacterales bacterium]
MKAIKDRLDDRLKGDKQRQMKWRNKQKEQGKKTIAAQISSEAQDILTEEKERTGETNSQLVERLILSIPALRATKGVTGKEQQEVEDEDDILRDEDGNIVPRHEWDF